MADPDPNLDLLSVLRAQTAGMSHLTSAIEIMSEELRLLREAANDDAGANEISEHLAMLDTSVNALPDKLADRAQTIADTAARKTLSDMPC